jgi:hypothetical protein
MNDFIGIYADKWFGEVEVYEKDKQLWFKSNRSPKLNGLWLSIMPIHLL